MSQTVIGSSPAAAGSSIINTNAPEGESGANAIRKIPLPESGTGPSLAPGQTLLVASTGWQTGDNAVATRANINGLNDGLTTPGTPNGSVQSSGPLTLSTADWDAQTGGSGGLTPGAIYYNGVNGALVTTPPTASGSYSAIVGVAETAETMNIMLFAANGPHG